MNRDQIQSNWNVACDKIKLTWGKLSEDDLTAIGGQRDQLSSLLQEKYGWKKADAETRVDDFAHGLTP
jgi:uncharacterized protein YjbJ (UPF0337 family)